MAYATAPMGLGGHGPTFAAQLVSTHPRALVPIPNLPGRVCREHAFQEATWPTLEGGILGCGIDCHGEGERRWAN